MENKSLIANIFKQVDSTDEVSRENSGNPTNKKKDKNKEKWKLIIF